MIPDMLRHPHFLTGFFLVLGFSVGDARGSSGGPVLNASSVGEIF
jgi:hypothetical protein